MKGTGGVDIEYGILTFKSLNRDISRKIIHVDMDAFYASVELKDNPSLQGQPVVIARHPKEVGGRGVVTTANYVARTYGIHSAMSAREAFKLCPHAIFIPPNFKRYREVSQQIQNIVRSYTDQVQPLSLDEAYLDVTHNHIGLTSATLIAKKIQQDIFNETQLTCSAGVSYNRFLAKVASDYQKPSGLTVVTPEDAHCFLMQLPIDSFFGVGKRTVERMHALGVYTGKDLYEKSVYELIEQFGKMGFQLYQKVRGVDNSPVKVNRVRKSVGKESTFWPVLLTDDSIIQQLRSLSRQTARQLQNYQLHGKTVVLKYRYDGFITHTKRQTVNRYLQGADDLFDIACRIWYTYGEAMQGVRLLGVTVTGLDAIEYQDIPLVFDELT